MKSLPNKIDLSGFRLTFRKNKQIAPKVKIVDAKDGLLSISAKNSSPGIYQLILESDPPRKDNIRLNIEVT